MRTSLPARRKTGETILTRPPEADLIPVITLPDTVVTVPDDHHGHGDPGQCVDGRNDSLHAAEWLS